MTEPALYVYAIVPAQLRAEWGDGLDRCAVFAVESGELAALVHEVPSATPYQGPDAAVRAWVATHHEVVDRAWQVDRSVLPMTFDVLVRGDGDATATERLRAWLRTDHAQITEALERVRGRSEVTVEVSVSRADARLDDATDEALEDARRALEVSPPGARVLHRRRVADLERSRAERIADALYPDLRATLARASFDLVERRRARAEATSAIVLSAALLVDDARIADIGAALGELQEARPYLSIRFLGPWAPYSFASLERTEHEAHERSA